MTHQTRHRLNTLKVKERKPEVETLNTNIAERVKQIVFDKISCNIFA